jgi:hypothetical protein
MQLPLLGLSLFVSFGLILNGIFMFIFLKALQAINPTFKFYSHGVYFEPICNNTADSLDHGLLFHDNRKKFLDFKFYS